jgi:hypothetical protein
MIVAGGVTAALASHPEAGPGPAPPASVVGVKIQVQDLTGVDYRNRASLRLEPGSYCGALPL